LGVTVDICDTHVILVVPESIQRESRAAASMVAIGDSRCTSQRVRVRVKESSENVTKQEHLIEKLTRCSVEEALRYRIDDLLSSRNQLGHGRLSVFLL
jgi:hypothetical protein